MNFKRAVCAALLAAALASSFDVPATATPDQTALYVGPRAAGDATTILSHYVGRFGIKPTVIDASFRLAIDPGQRVHLSWGKDHGVAGALLPDGSIQVASTSPIYDYVKDYNTITDLIGNQPAMIATGTTWNADLWVKVSPVMWIRVPSTVLVIDASEKGFTLDAMGDKAGELTYDGFATPYDVTARISATFDRTGKCVAASFDDRELLKLSEEIVFAYSWQFILR